MTFTNHLMTGAAIGMAVDRPLIALPLAFLSHFVLDALPHFGTKYHERHEFHVSSLKRAVLAIDAILGFSLLLWLLLGGYYFGLLCAVTAFSPDFAWVARYAAFHLRENIKSRNLFSRFHAGIQWCERPWGILVEAGYFGIVIRLLSRLV